MLVQRHCGIDDEFAIGLSNQVIRICQVRDYEVFSVLDDNFRQIIQLLMGEKPILLWQSLSHFFEIATPSEIDYLETLVGPLQDTFDGKSHNQAGTLFGISDIEYIKWARIKPRLRAPFLCIFYPVLDASETDNHKWHPALETLTHEFGTVPEFRQALADRLYPSLWSGSIVPHLEMYLKLLQKWFRHPVTEMALWAQDESRSLERRITWERRLEGRNVY